MEVDKMEFHDFMALHHGVKHLSARKLKSIVSSLDHYSLQQLLLVYCQFFWNLNNRNKYDRYHESNRCHSEIIQKLQQKIKIRNQSNSFSKLPSLLTAYIISFLDTKSRSRASFVNHSFLKISNERIAINHLNLSTKFIKDIPVLCDQIKLNHIFDCHTNKVNRHRNCYFTGLWENKYNKYALKYINQYANKYINKYRNIQSITGHKVSNTQRKRKIFKSNWPKLFTLLRLKNMHVRDLNDSLLNNINIQQLTFLTVSGRSQALDQIKSVWINQENPSSVVDISKNNNKYLIKRSNLKVLTIQQAELSTLLPIKCDLTATPHPIFWLWNIPNLESCSMPIQLFQIHTFKTEFDKLLSASIFNQSLRKKSKFKKLSLYFEDTLFTNEILFNDEILCAKLNLFLKNIRKLYPTLNSIQYKFPAFGYFRRFYDYDCSLFSKSLDWSAVFYNLSEIKIDVLSMNIATDLLLYLRKNHCLTVCHLNNIQAMYTIKVDGMYTTYEGKCYNPMDDFIDNVCDFIVNRPTSLNSFAIKFDYTLNGTTYDMNDLKNVYYGAYEKYLSFLLNRIAHNNDIFDGYLKLELPYVFGFYKYIKGRYIDCSLKS